MTVQNQPNQDTGDELEQQLVSSDLSSFEPALRAKFDRASELAHRQDHCYPALKFML